MQWVSGTSREQTLVMGQTNCSQTHAKFFEHVKLSYAIAFEEMCASLKKIEQDMMDKLVSIEAQQQETLASCVPTMASIQDLNTNIARFDRKLETFTAHASNLCHIKLTLARAAAFVSGEDSVADLVTRPNQLSV